jgi:hypothetical protein
VRAALAVPPLAAALAALPAAAEAWRERQCGGRSKGSGPPQWTRAARDAAMAPFFGNSIAVRSSGRRDKKEQVAAAEATTAAASSWPPLLLARREGEASATTMTPAAWPRTPGEAVAAAFAFCCGNSNGAPSAAVDAAASPSSRVWVEGGHEVLVLGGFRAAHRVLVGVRLQDDEEESRRRQQQPSNSGGSGRGGGGEAAAPTDPHHHPHRQAFLWVVNAHLDHADPATRAEQARAILRWIDAPAPAPAPRNRNRPRHHHPPSSAAAVVLAGDFNAPPQEAGVHGALRSAGFVSAHAAAHGGREPERTWPTGLQAPLADDEGEPHCADYVYVREEQQQLGRGRRKSGARRTDGDDDGGAANDDDQLRVRVVGARVAADEPWPADPTLRASDHAAVRAVLRVERRVRASAGERGGARRGWAATAADEGF